MRIGIATARALAQALGTPVVGVSTLQSLALGVRRDPRAGELDAVVAVLDARRHEVFAGAWRVDEVEDPGHPVIEPGAFAPESLGARLPRLGPDVLAIGEGAVEFRAELERSGAAIPDDRTELHQVTAVGHCRLARRLEPTPPDRVLPDYLRAPDAKLPRPR